VCDTQKHSEHFNGLSLAELSVIATEHQLQHTPHGGYIAKHDQAVRVPQWVVRVAPGG